MSWNSLHLKDLLVKIAKHVLRKSVFNMRLVCSAWNNYLKPYTRGFVKPIKSIEDYEIAKQYKMTNLIFYISCSEIEFPDYIRVLSLPAGIAKRYPRNLQCLQCDTNDDFDLNSLNCKPNMLWITAPQIIGNPMPCVSKLSIKTSTINFDLFPNLIQLRLTVDSAPTGTLPKSLKSLFIVLEDNAYLTLDLPEDLESLQCIFGIIQLDRVPKGIKQLEGKMFQNTQNHLNFLRFSKLTHLRCRSDQPFDCALISPNITNLDLSINSIINIEFLRHLSCLTKLSLNIKSQNLLVLDLLPPSLNSLRLVNGNFTVDLTNSSIKSLSIARQTHVSLKGKLPQTLTYLSVSDEFISKYTAVHKIHNIVGVRIGIRQDFDLSCLNDSTIDKLNIYGNKFSDTKLILDNIKNLSVKYFEYHLKSPLDQEELLSRIPSIKDIRIR